MSNNNSQRRISALFLIVSLFLATGCVFGREEALDETTEEWFADVQFLNEAILNDFGHLFQKIDRREFEYHVEMLKKEIPDSTRDEIIVKIASLIARFGVGHTRVELEIDAAESTTGFRSIPLQIYLFPDGPYVTSAHKEYRELLGSRVEKIGSMPIDQVIRKIRPVVSFENEMGFRSQSPRFLLCPNVLQALGIIETVDEIPITVSRESETREFNVRVPENAERDDQYNITSTSGSWCNANEATDAGQLWLAQLERKRFFKYLPEQKTLYVRHSQVLDDQNESVEEFFSTVFEFVEQNTVDKFILDVRLNDGGNNHLNIPVIKGILRSKINRQGKLFVILGRRTFSACQNLVNVLEKYSDAIFVGEPTSQNINFFGDNDHVVLPNSRLVVSLSRLWWQDSEPRDHRAWTPPHIAVDLTFSDFARNHDPVIETVLAIGPECVANTALQKLFETKRYDELTAKAREMVGNSRYRYVHSSIEKTLNDAGYELLKNNEPESAAKIFLSNCKLFPNSANACDSLGECQLRLGFRSDAIECFRRAVRLDQGGEIGNFASNRLAALNATNQSEEDVEPLDFGPHVVGFRYEYHIDESREWDPWPFAEDEETETTKRPIRIAVWYPASAKTGDPMAFRQYVTPDSDDVYYSKLNEVMRKYDLWSYGGMMKESDEAVERLLNLETQSFYNSPARKGQFPVLLYSSGWFSRSPDNAHFCEYLASHGYIVVTVPQLGTGSTIYDFRVTADRIKTQVDDLKYACEAIRKWDSANGDQIGAIGFSTGGVVALWLSQVEPGVRAVVGLDPSYVMKDFLTVSGKGIVNKRNGLPILTLYRGHPAQSPNVSLELIKTNGWAEHFVVEVPDATHGEFSDEPFLLGQLEAEWPREKYNTQTIALTRYFSTTRFVRSFLDVVLKGNETGTESLNDYLDARSRSAGFEPNASLSVDDD